MQTANYIIMFLLTVLLIWPIRWQIREDVKTACVYVESLTKEFVFTMKDVTQLLVKVCAFPYWHLNNLDLICLRRWVLAKSLMVI
jgi:hypothetical protein